MRKSQNVSALADRIESGIPQLSFTAYYEAEDPMLLASMRSYRNRAFVYVLAVDVQGKEEYIYVGKTMNQYSRLLQHMENYFFDRVYLFTCEEDILESCEAKTIKLLMPLYNRHHNPNAFRYQRVLNLNYDAVKDAETTLGYLDMWRAYNNSVLYGFALPPVLYSILKCEADAHGRSVSSELTDILEALFAEGINSAVMGDAVRKTNLVTTATYAAIHGRSQEQIKQYLHQNGRMVGEKIGRDWVILEDEAYPEDRRERGVIR